MLSRGAEWGLEKHEAREGDWGQVLKDLLVNSGTLFFILRAIGSLGRYLSRFWLAEVRLDPAKDWECSDG